MNSINQIIKTLKSSSSARDVKEQYGTGTYDLESCVIECLGFLYDPNPNISQHEKTEAIMHFLHT